MTDVRVGVRSVGVSTDRSAVTGRAEQDFAGSVLEVRGAAVGLQVGDAVLGWFDSEALTSDLDVWVPAHHLIPKPDDLEWSVAGGLRAAAELAWDAVRSIGPHPIMAVGVGDADSLAGLIAAQLLLATRAHPVSVVAGDSLDWFETRGLRPVARGGRVLAAIRERAPHGLAGLLELGDSLPTTAATELGVGADQAYSVRRSEDPGSPTAHAPVRATGSTAVLERIVGLVTAGLIDVPVAEESSTPDLRTVLARMRAVEPTRRRALGIVSIVTR